MSAERARVFLALACGEELGRRLHERTVEALGGTERARHGFRLPRPEGLHLTLFFAGDLDPDRVQALREAAAGELGGGRAPRLLVDAAGAFPARGRERVLWLGVREEGAERLAELARRSLAAARRAGLDVTAEERRPFRPHVTVARPRGRVARVPETFYELALEESWRPGEVVLLESVRAETGPPRYLPRDGWALPA